MPKRTLLLVFIHGFKGGDDTFARFPPHLRAILSHALPQFHVVQITYPKFETRGDLKETVASFKEWLQNKVIDLEVANGTPSPTIDPSVRTILIGHSMGGIVAAETILAITRDQPINSSDKPDKPEIDVPFMFPSILGLLAFDTPYLGISPGVVAHGAESHYQNIKGAWSAYNTVSSVFGGGAGASNASSQPAPPGAKSLPLGPSASDPDTATVPAWQRWGRYAMYAGAAGAVLAGGAAAYANRAQISEGWGWATSHLEFVGCLARGAELEARVTAISELGATRGLGFRNMFTVLGREAGTLTWNDASEESGGTGGGGKTVGEASGGPKGEFAHKLAAGERTFCLLPKGKSRAFFESTVNDKADSEIAAHMNMFTPRENPGYYMMSERAKQVVCEWVQDNWPVREGENEVVVGAEEDVEIVDVEEAKEEPEVVRKEEVKGMEENPWKS